MIGGQVGIAGHAKIGDKVGLGAQSGVCLLYTSRMDQKFFP